MFENKTVSDVISITKAGAGFKHDVRAKTVTDIIQIAKAGNGRIVFAD